MHLLLTLATLCLVVGHLWFGLLLLRDGDTLLGLCVLAIPMPLVGLFAWHRSGWEPSYKWPAITYFAGYVLVILLQLSM